MAPVLMSEWLAGHPPQEERRLEPGTFFEVAQQWEAGEDYADGGRTPRGALQRLVQAQKALRAQQDVDRRLLDLAWKHLLASAYETAWYDPSRTAASPLPGPRRWPATPAPPW